MRRTVASLVVLAGLAASGWAQSTAPVPPAVDDAINVRIRAEGMERSRLMSTLHVLTDRYGPRLTGSPNHEQAARWAVDQLTAWGLVNARLDPWNFNRDGWYNVEASGHIVSPVRDTLVFEVLAWTPSTPGPVNAPAVWFELPAGPERPGGGPRLGPTDDELSAYLTGMAPRTKGAIVLVGGPARVPFDETPPARRRDDEEVRAQFDPSPDAVAGRRGGRGGRAGGGGRGRGGAPEGPRRLSAGDVSSRLNAFLLEQGAAVRVLDAGREHGQIRAFSFSGYDVTKTVPTVVLRNEDYGRIVRLIAGGAPVTLKFDIRNESYPAGRTSYNVLAEIAGTDRADEVVMLGAHLDSWHAATGATDNAVGCAVMMEAVRILKAIDARPRRTIRIALWSGEEQGLLGSRAYVAEQFGTVEKPKPAFERFNGYLNLDTGTGRLRGATVYGPPAAAAYLARLFEPFRDFGIVGARATISRGGGGTDSGSFNSAGLPGINFSQDPIEYGSHTWHTNLDTYERIVEQDVRQAAVIVASTVYHLAMDEETLPRIGGR
jgi:hypothetical protein